MRDQNTKLTKEVEELQSKLKEKVGDTNDVQAILVDIENSNNTCNYQHVHDL